MFMGFRVQGFRVWGLGFMWSFLVCGFSGLGLELEGLAFRILVQEFFRAPPPSPEAPSTRP